MLFIVADSLHWDLVMVAGFAAALVLGAYGTVMRFRRPKQERRPSWILPLGSCPPRALTRTHGNGLSDTPSGQAGAAQPPLQGSTAGSI